MSTLRTNVLENLNSTASIDLKAIALNQENYIDLGAYAPGITFNKYSETFTLSGLEYRPLSTTALPYTTLGTGGAELALFTVIGDSALRNDLSNPSLGADLVAYSNRTVATQLADRKSILEFIPEEEHAAIIAGTSTYDATAGIQAAIDFSAISGKIIWIPFGRYNYSKLIIKGGFTGFHGEGQYKSRFFHIPNSSTGATIEWDSVRVNYPSFIGFSIEGSGHNTEAAGMDMTGFNYCFMQCVDISGFYGPNIRATGYYDNAFSASTIVNTFVHCKFGVSVSANGVQFYAPTVPYTLASLIGWRFFSCYFNHNTGANIYARFGEDMQFDGCLTEGSALLADIDDCNFFKFDGYTESRTDLADFNIGPNALGFSIVPTRFTYPLWNLITANSTIGKGRIEFAYAPPGRSCTDNGDLSNLDSAGVPVNMTGFGSSVINQTISEAASIKGAVMSVTIPANTAGSGVDIRLKGFASQYYGKRVTFRIRHRSTGVSSLNLRVFPRLGTTNNTVNGMYYSRAYTNPAGFVDLIADVVFADTSGSPTDSVFLRFQWESMAGTNPTGAIRLDEVDVYEGGFLYPFGNSTALREGDSVLQTATITSATSWVNILNKRHGRRIYDRQTGISYIATGSAATSPWQSITTGASLTPV